MISRSLVALAAALLLLCGCRGAEKTPPEPTSTHGAGTDFAVAETARPEPIPALYALDGETDTASALTLSATEPEENAVQLTNGALLTLHQSDLNKLGDAADAAAAVPGGNACIFVGSGSALTLDDTSVTTAALLAPALTVTGEGSACTATNGIMATSGDRAPLIESLDAGVVDLFHATLMSEGAMSPCFSVDNAAVSAVSGSMRASGDAVARLSGGARLTIENADLAGRGGFVFTTGEDETATAAITGGYISVTDGAPCFWVTAGNAAARMEFVTLPAAPESLIRAENGHLTLTCVRQQLSGTVTAGENARVTLALTEGSAYTGAFPADGVPFVSLVLDSTSTWQVTAESFLSVLTGPDTAFAGIQSNGFNVYYDSSNIENVMLNAKSYLLPGGGFLIPLI